MSVKRSTTLLTLLLGVAAACSNAAAGSIVTVGSNIVASERVSIDQIDHSIWDGVLNELRPMVLPHPHRL